MPFTKLERSKDRKTNGKCTNATNRRSRIWPTSFILAFAASRLSRSSHAVKNKEKPLGPVVSGSRLSVVGDEGKKRGRVRERGRIRRGTFRFVQRALQVFDRVFFKYFLSKFARIKSLISQADVIHHMGYLLKPRLKLIRISGRIYHQPLIRWQTIIVKHNLSCFF